MKPKLFTTQTPRGVARVGRLERPRGLRGHRGVKKNILNKKCIFSGQQIKYTLKRALMCSCNYFHIRKPVGTVMVMHRWRGVARFGVMWRGVGWRGVAWRVVGWRGVAWRRVSLVKL